MGTALSKAARVISSCVMDPSPPPHVLARSEGNKLYKGKRAEVPDWRVPWLVLWPGYAPIEFTAEVVARNPPWADPSDASRVDFSTRHSFHGPIFVDSRTKRPRNPMGRTGTAGRGLLGKWGPNHAADPIVLRVKPLGPGEQPRTVPGVPGGVPFQMVAIRRADSGQWAIPGGMVDAGEVVSQTLRREFAEEASNTDAVEAAQMEEALDEIFKEGGVRVYEGYVDDPRNTDNAWMETSVWVYFVKGPAAELLKLHGGSDATHAEWVDVDARLLDTSSGQLYADHGKFVQAAVSRAAAKLPNPYTSETDRNRAPPGDDLLAPRKRSQGVPARPQDRATRSRSPTTESSGTLASCVSAPHAE
mmetsp:Transcript_9898/g.29113  ORF Transcript_9898/g.29113 Transcript_9898/m.29113 type:complete len:360 (+) Transcript_9898:87-1166(+)